jgi:hypothetical protein
LEATGATHFIYGSLAQWRYENDAGINPLDNQIIAALGRKDIMELALNFTKGRFRYELYELHLDKRFLPKEETGVGHYIDDEVIFGDFVRYVGDGVGNTQLMGNIVFIRYLWEVLEQPDSDYRVQVSLFNTGDGQIYQTWEGPVNPHTHGSDARELYYNSQVWDVGERIIDWRSMELPDNLNPPVGRDIYRLIINFVDAKTGEIVPMTINGESADGYPIMAKFSYGG